jgi:O-antigen ligase
MTTPAGVHSGRPSVPDGGGESWIVVWLAFVLVGLDLVYDPTVYDRTLVPRLHALLVGLAAALPVLALPRVSRRLDLSVLREPVILCAVAYAACTAASLSVAVNVTAGLLDVIRTWAFALVLALSCLLLPLLPRWPDRLVQSLVVATLIIAGASWSELVMKHGLGMHPRHTIQEVSGGMGNVNFLASYLVVVLPGCLAAVCLLRGPWRALGLLGAAAAIGLVVLLQSRASYLALVAGALAALAVAWACRARLGLGRTFRRLLVTGAVGSACAVGVFVTVAGPDHPLMARLRSIGEERRPDGIPSDGGRTMIWRLTARLIADHPLVGVGAGNFSIRIQEYYNDPGVDLGALHSDIWLQAHNDLLQVWAEKGVAGLVAVAGIFLSGLVSVGAIVRRSASPAEGGLAVFLLMSLVSYLVSSCFDFPLERVSHQTTLAVLLAAATVARRQAVPGTTPPWPPTGLPRGLLPAAVGGLVASLVAGIAWTSTALDQERDTVATQQALEERRWDDAVRLARRAATPWRTLDPRGTPVAFLEGLAHMRRGDADAATACLERARLDNPNRLVVINNLGILHATAGRLDQAIECFTLAVKRYPYRLEGVTNLAACYLDAGRPREAIALLEQVPAEQRTAVMRGHLDRGRAMMFGPAAPD